MKFLFGSTGAPVRGCITLLSTLFLSALFSLRLASAVAPTIRAGGDHACAVTQSGGVKCWGGNFYGELGDGTTSSRDRPQDLPGFTQGVKAVASGTSHTCLLTMGGSVKCRATTLMVNSAMAQMLTAFYPRMCRDCHRGVCPPSSPAEIALAHCLSRAA